MDEPEYAKSLKKYLEQALEIYRNGACNIPAVALTLLEMSRIVGFSQFPIGPSTLPCARFDLKAGLRLILAQMNHLTEAGYGNYAAEDRHSPEKDIEECEQAIAALNDWLAAQTL